MLRKMSVYFKGVPSAYVDGAIYVSMAFFSAWYAVLTSDDAEKWLEAHLLFWLKALVGSIDATLLALKMFRSDTFAKHKQQKEKDAVNSNETTQIYSSGNSGNSAA